MSGIKIEHTEGLIRIFRYPATFRIGDIRDFFAELEKTNPQRQKHAVIVDLTELNPFSISTAARLQSAEILQEHIEFLAETCLCEARVVSTPIARGMLTVFDWLHPKPWPINNVNSGNIGEQWIRSRLKKMGYQPDPEPVWL